VTRRPPPGTPIALRLAATLFLVGEVVPLAPATAASLVVAPVFFWFPTWPGWIQCGIALALTWAGIFVCTRAETAYGHDAKPIVLDEVAGMVVTFLLVPWPAAAPDRWLLCGAGFVLFRIFDVVKPFPANRAQSLPGGRGVMTDDLIAGLYANAGVRVVAALLLR
jgi:phosphatidylglycerophosphatase A